MKGLYRLSIFVAVIVISSSIALANANMGFFGNRDVAYKRVIADHFSERDIQAFQSRGCLVKHRLSNFVSYECPEDIVPSLDAREARIFRITDINADQQIDADLVWAEGIDGSGVNVAVLDTGIDTDHPQLADSYLGGYDVVNDDPVPEDDHGHGTHVAGIITSNSGNSKGVSPGAGIYMYKVCNPDGNCYEDDMIAGMEAAVLTDAEIMSISIGGGIYTGANCDFDSLAQKVNWVVDQGLTVVISSGNDGRGVSSPGCASKVIAVGAVDSSNNVPYWSGRGPALDIVAPGSSIYSTLINGYGYMSGTSMAAPHVAGVAALLLEADSGLTTNEIKTALYDTASPVNRCYRCTFYWRSTCYRQAEVPCTSDIEGAGVVNAYDAYSSLDISAPDSDGDGVVDSQDACPTVFGTFCNGCPEPSCSGCASSFCPVDGVPVCQDDDLLCVAPYATGTCSSGMCSFVCISLSIIF